MKALRPEHERILRACRERERALETEAAPLAWQTWLVEDWSEQQEHGPRYSAVEWFDNPSEVERQRLRRAMDDLERAGLVETWARYGRRISHVKLTPLGLEAAQALAGEPAAAPEADDTADAPGRASEPAGAIPEPVHQPAEV